MGEETFTLDNAFITNSFWLSSEFMAGGNPGREAAAKITISLKTTSQGCGGAAAEGPS